MESYVIITLQMPENLRQYGGLSDSPGVVFKTSNIFFLGSEDVCAEKDFTASDVSHR